MGLVLISVQARGAEATVITAEVVVMSVNAEVVNVTIVTGEIEWSSLDMPNNNV